MKRSPSANTKKKIQASYKTSIIIEEFYLWQITLENYHVRNEIKLTELLGQHGGGQHGAQQGAQQGTYTQGAQQGTQQGAQHGTAHGAQHGAQQEGGQQDIFIVIWAGS